MTTDIDSGKNIIALVAFERTSKEEALNRATGLRSLIQAGTDEYIAWAILGEVSKMEDCKARVLEYTARNLDALAQFIAISKKLDGKV